MKKYQTPFMETIINEENDVITASALQVGGTGTNDNPIEW